MTPSSLPPKPKLVPGRGTGPGFGDIPGDSIPCPHRVIEYKEENRMSVQSIAIVFGPTLLRPASEEGNMAMHMVFQNQVVEHILNQYSYIFPDG